MLTCASASLLQVQKTGSFSFNDQVAGTPKIGKLVARRELVPRKEMWNHASGG